MMSRGDPQGLDMIGRLLRRGVVPIHFIDLSLGLVGAGCQEPAETTAVPGTSLNRKSTMLTSDEALAIARKAIAGKAELQKGAPVSVERKDGAYVVTFVHINPPGTRGPDYDARVTIDAETGKVTELLGAS